MTPRYARKQILVEKAVQFRFARFVMFFVIATALLTSSVVFFTTMTVLGDKLAAVYPQGRLAPIVRTAYIAFFVNLLVAAPFIFYVSIKFSHRIVGPLPKVYRFLKEAGEGFDPGKLILRKGDELVDLAESINSMLGVMRERGVISKRPEEKPSRPR